MSTVPVGTSAETARDIVVTLSGSTFSEPGEWEAKAERLIARALAARDAEIARLRYEISGLEQNTRADIQVAKNIAEERNKAEARVARLEAALRDAITPLAHLPTCPWCGARAVPRNQFGGTTVNHHPKCVGIESSKALDA